MRPYRPSKRNKATAACTLKKKTHHEETDRSRSDDRSGPVRRPDGDRNGDASGRCPTNYEYNPSTGMCHPIFSTQINGCDTSVGSTPEQERACWCDDWM